MKVHETSKFNKQRRKQKEKTEKEALRAPIKVVVKDPQSGKLINIQSAQ